MTVSRGTKNNKIKNLLKIIVASRVMVPETPSCYSPVSKRQDSTTPNPPQSERIGSETPSLYSDERLDAYSTLNFVITSKNTHVTTLRSNFNGRPPVILVSLSISRMQSILSDQSSTDENLIRGSSYQSRCQNAHGRYSG
jgi:hypothetical protein